MWEQTGLPPEQTDAIDPVLWNDWYVVAKVDELVNGPKRARLFGRNLIVWKASDQVQVWQDLCVHRGTPLTLRAPQDGAFVIQQQAYTAGRIKCAYHGYEYGPGGGCLHIPQHPTQTIPPHIRVRQTYPAVRCYGLVFTSLGRPDRPLPCFPEWFDPTFRKIDCGPYHVSSSGTRMVENFADVAHFPFVHFGLLGDPKHAVMDLYKVRRTTHGIIAEDITVYQPDPDGTGQGGNVTYTYEILAPLVIRFHKVGEKRYGIIFFVTPVEQMKCIGWMINFINHDQGIPDTAFQEFEDRIMSQDTPVVEAQRPELLPLDLQRELQRPSDQFSVEYRRWLRELGVTYLTE